MILCLIYIGLLAVLLALGFSSLIRCEENHRNLRRNANDIERTLKAGERGRADVRDAVAAPEPSADGRVLRTPQRSGEVTSHFDGNTVWRDSDDRHITFLKSVKSSQMFSAPREHVHAWRWEVELASPQKIVRVRPLFTFQAVPR